MRKQQAERVGEVVVAERRHVVVHLVHPHIGVERLGVEGGPVRLLLGILHQTAKVLGDKILLGALLEDGFLEEESREDIAHRLGDIREPRVQKRDALLGRLRLLDRSAHEHKLVEVRGRLGNRHGVTPVQRAFRFNLLPMEGMPELVCDRVDRAQRAIEVGEHAALTLVGEVPAEGAAALSRARIEVDPALVEGSPDKLAEFGREASQVLDQVRARRLDGKRGRIGRLAHDRGEEIPPWKAVFVPENLRFALEVGLKRRQMLRHDLPQHIERLASHPRLEERHIERGREPAHLRLQDDLLFDAVK